MASLRSLLSFLWTDGTNEERELLPKEIRALLETTPSRVQSSYGLADTAGTNFSLATGFTGNYFAIIANVDAAASLRVLTNIPTTTGNTTMTLAPGQWIRIPVNNGVGIFPHTLSGTCKFFAAFTGPG